MKTRTTLIRIFLLLAVILLPTSAAHAQTPGGDVVRFGENYTLEKGETLNGSLAVFGGNILIEKEATVAGDVALFGGNLSAKEDTKLGGDIVLFGGNISIDGTVDGDIVVFGGQVELTKTAVVNGNISTIGGQVSRDPDAQVNGDITNNAPPMNVPDVPGVPNVPNIPGTPNSPNVTYSYNNPFWNALSALFRALAVAAVAMLLSLFFQPQFERVSDAIMKQPVTAGGFGLLTLIVAPVAIVIMTVTILLIPLALITALVIPIAWLFGVIAIGQEVGDRFTKAINQTWAPVLSTGFGTLLLMLLGGFFGMIPCIGWLIPFVVALLGLGGVAMTWFGTRNPPGPVQSQTQVVEVPPAS
jgi:cytoskeletal protein CcmA (bactofilin family)